MLSGVQALHAVTCLLLSLHIRRSYCLGCDVPTVHDSYFESKQTELTLILKDVCFDQDTIIVHDEAYAEKPEFLKGQGLPEFDLSKFTEFHKHVSRRPNPLRPITGSECKHDPLRFRYPSAQEAQRATHFSSCTVPMLIFQHWPHVFGEYFTRAPVYIHHLQEQREIDRNVTLVLAACGAVPLEPYHRQLLQPFSVHQVMSWGTFAAPTHSVSHGQGNSHGRNNGTHSSDGTTKRSGRKALSDGSSSESPSDTLSNTHRNTLSTPHHIRTSTSNNFSNSSIHRNSEGARKSHSAPYGIHSRTHRKIMQHSSTRSTTHSSSNSPDSTRVQCFSKAIIVGLKQDYRPKTFKAAQHILSYYQQKGKVPSMKLFSSGPEVLKVLFEYRPAAGHEQRGSSGISIVQPLAADSPAVARHSANFPAELKGRPVYPGTRQILNLQEILDECNRHSWVLEGTPWKGVECRAYSFGENLLEGMAVTQQTDVFMSLHGSGEMNAMFLRPDSQKIQLRSKEFGTRYRYMSDGYWPVVCVQMQFPFQCWSLNFDEDDTWEPGVYERMGHDTDSETTRRDRHLRLKFKHFEAALKEILPVKGNRNEYQRLWDARKVSITFNQDQTTTYFNHMP